MDTYLVYGLGRSGIATANLLVKNDEHVILYDDDKTRLAEIYKSGLVPKSCEIIDKLCAKTLCIVHCIVLSPGVAVSKRVAELIKKFNIMVLGELNLGAYFCPAPIYAVTGTNGKTTTCTLLYDMLLNSKIRAHLVGNIGTPITSKVDSVAPSDSVVCEVSSFQLEHPTGLIFKASAVLNLAPDHLDRYVNFTDYVDTKRKILDCTHGKVFLNYDDPIVRDFGKNRTDCEYFSLNPLPEGVEGIYYKDGAIYRHNSPLLSLKKCKLLGKHNLYNILCATSLALYAGADAESIERALNKAKLPSHRLEFAGKINGVRYYDDSKATNIASTTVALECFDKDTVVLMLGGSDKGEDFAGFLNNMPDNVRKIVAFGRVGKKIYKLAKKRKLDTIYAPRLEEAFMLAKNSANEGDVVLLSPACASFDEFDSFEERGDFFKSLVGRNEAKN